jgi:large conductance mechanosensitive channel
MGKADLEVMAKKIKEGEERVIAENKRKRKEKMKKERVGFFADFKKFITRGNVVDMAVGVIVGGAFTAIVNGMSNFILKPITNWILALIIGQDALTAQYTYLKRVDTLDEAGNFVLDELGQKVPDLTQSIYIDWGSFINAVINFFLVAFVLFVIVRFINRVRENNQENAAKIAKYKLSREEKAELKANGIKRSDKAAVKAYFDAKAAKAAEEAAKAEAEAAAKAAAERLANPTTEDLLKKIIVLLEKN